MPRDTNELLNRNCLNFKYRSFERGRFVLASEMLTLHRRSNAVFSEAALIAETFITYKISMSTRLVVCGWRVPLTTAAVISYHLHQKRWILGS